jgi:hypothetical protein
MEKGEKWCPECGCSFKGPTKTCSEECRDTRLKQRQRSLGAKMTLLRRVLESEKVWQRDDRLMYSENFIESVLAGGCIYCGMDGTELQSFTGHCLDRIKNTGKHTSDNIAACCPQCNSIKSDLLSLEEMALLHPGLIAIRNRRGNLNSDVINARQRRKNGR